MHNCEICNKELNYAKNIHAVASICRMCFNKFYTCTSIEFTPEEMIKAYAVFSAAMIYEIEHGTYRLQVEKEPE